MKQPTIFEALRAKLGREPTNAECKEDVFRILREAADERRVAINKAIASSNRSGRRIGKAEARLIHKVLA
jgi:hypothetical protein